MIDFALFIDRVEKALADSGYPVRISAIPIGEKYAVSMEGTCTVPPLDLLYRAMELADPTEPRACFDCWQTFDLALIDECVAGRCAS